MDKSDLIFTNFCTTYYFTVAQMASLKDLCLTTLEDHGDEYDLRELCDIRGCSYIMSSLFGVSEHPQWCCKNLVSICPLGTFIDEVICERL